jgi:hypothetical protein
MARRSGAGLGLFIFAKCSSIMNIQCPAEITELLEQFPALGLKNNHKTVTKIQILVKKPSLSPRQEKWVIQRN